MSIHSVSTEISIVKNLLSSSIIVNSNFTQMISQISISLHCILTVCGFQVEVERIRGQAHDKLMNKLAAARHKAEEKRAAAETKRNRQASKTEQQTEYIRRTGRIPYSFSCCGWCS